MVEYTIRINWKIVAWITGLIVSHVGAFAYGMILPV